MTSLPASCAIFVTEIAILSRSNARVQQIAAELQLQGVPAAIAQAGLLKTQEALLAIACIRRLNDPADTIASAEIHALASSLEPESWLEDRLQLMAEAPADKPRGYGNDWGEKGGNVLLSALAQMRRDMQVLSPLEALQTVIAQGQLSKIVRVPPVSLHT